MSIYDAETLALKVLLLVNIIYLVILKKHLTRSLILLLVLLFGVLVLELVIDYLANRGIPNVYLTHFYTSGQFLLISMIYFGELKRFKRIVPIGVIIYSSILIYQVIDSKIVFDQFNTSGFIFSACLMLMYALAYFVENIKEKKYWDTYNVGLFLYLGGSSVIFLTINSWKDLEGWNTLIWTINAGLIIIYQCFITSTIYRFHRLQKNQNGISSL